MVENYSLLPENYSLIPENYSLIPENYGLIPENYGLIPENYGLLPENYGLLPENYSSLPSNYSSMVVKIGKKAGNHQSYASKSVSYFPKSTNINNPIFIKKRNPRYFVTRVSEFVLNDFIGLRSFVWNQSTCRQ